MIHATARTTVRFLETNEGTLLTLFVLAVVIYVFWRDSK